MCTLKKLNNNNKARKNTIPFPNPPQIYFLTRNLKYYYLLSPSSLTLEYL